MLELQNIRKNFGKISVLADVSLQLPKSGVFAVLGPNGSGKTTLLKTILGMVIPAGGDITYRGQSILQDHRYRDQIGYLPQIARFPENLRVRELIAMIKDLRNHPADPDPLIATFRLNKFLDKKLRDLSGGTRQKVNIVLTFMFDLPVYILDEPTAGLDPASLLRLKELIRTQREQGKLILLTTHIMSLVEALASDVIFILEGNIYFQGPLGELKRQTDSQDIEHAIGKILDDAEDS